MTAQPHEYRGPVDRPRTVGAVKEALPEGLRGRFERELDETAPEGLFALVARWAAVAQAASDPGLDSAAAAVREGAVPTYKLGEVLPALADLL
ncbi:hypothetical protein ACWERV_22945 [Streptomyces sp. NPDC004031]